MTLPSSGMITWEMIRAEFGGGYPIYMSDYYRNGPRVPNTPQNANIPTSGPIYASQFYGAGATSPLNASLSPSSVNASRTNNGALSAGCTANPTGGNGTYSYSWSLAAPGLSLANATSQSCVVSGTATGSVERYGTLTCVITSNGVSVTKTVNVSFVWGTPI